MPAVKKIKKVKQSSGKEKKVHDETQAASEIPEKVENLNQTDSGKSEKLNKAGLFWIIFPIILIVLAVGTGFYIYMQGIKKIDLEKANQKSEIPEKVIPVNSPTPTILKKVNLKQYRIQILNGSGIEGAASIARKKLENEGYVILGIGNADNNNYSDDIIRYKNNIDPLFISGLVEFVGTEKIEKVENLEEDIVIILGL